MMSILMETQILICTKLFWPEDVIVRFQVISKINVPIICQPKYYR